MVTWDKLSRSEAARVFGALNYTQMKWLKAPTFCSSILVPTGFEDWINTATGVRVQRIYMNEQMHGPFIRALERVKERGLTRQLKTFDGCYNVRRVRGSDKAFSWHAYGLAIDVNAAENPLGKPGLISTELVTCFTSEGFVWGGDFKRQDPQHFQWGLE